MVGARSVAASERLAALTPDKRAYRKLPLHVSIHHLGSWLFELVLNRAPRNHRNGAVPSDRAVDPLPPSYGSRA
jgi:hypothetical protein